MINKEYLRNALTYEEFRQLGNDLVNQGKTTGNEQTPARIAFSKLNEARMKRIDKTFQLEATDLDVLKQIKRTVFLVVIAEHWCGDCSATLPVLNKLTEANRKIQVRILLRDDNAELMQVYATGEAHSVPKVIVLDENMKEIAHWGPRPAGAQQIMEDWKIKKDRPMDDAKEDIQRWYIQDKGRAIISEILALLPKQG